jgi:hypothetical protein
MVLTVNLTVKLFRHSVSDFYRQSGFAIAQKPTNNGVFRAPNRLAGQFTEIFAEKHVADARLIRCWHAFQQNPIAQAPLIVSDNSPKFLRTLLGFMSLAVT